MGNTRQKARRLQSKKQDATVAAKKVVLKLPASAKKGPIKKEDVSIDIEVSEGADDEESDELLDSQSDEYPEVEEMQEGSEAGVDGEDGLDGDQDELAEEAPVVLPADDYILITYLVPKDGTNTFKPLELSNSRSWQTFKREVGKIMGVKPDELSVSWRFSSAKSTHPFQSLDSGDEYRAMRTAFGMARNKARKGSAPLSIHIKSQIDPPKPTVGSSRRKAGAKAKADPPPEDNDAPPHVWQIIGKLRERYVGKCSRPDHSEKPCYLTNDGAHHILTIANLTTWATVIFNGEATYSNPPAALKLSDHIPPPRGVPQKHSDAPNNPPSQPQNNFLSDATALSALIGAAVTAATQAAGRPGPSTHHHAAPFVDHTQENEALDFPSLREWLTSITDVQPQLLGYIDVLEGQGLTKLSHVDNTDLTVPTLMSFSGMKFLEASTFLRMGRKACEDFRDVFKK